MDLLLMARKTQQSSTEMVNHILLQTIRSRSLEVSYRDSRQMCICSWWTQQLIFKSLHRHSTHYVTWETDQIALQLVEPHTTQLMMQDSSKISRRYNVPSSDSDVLLQMICVNVPHCEMVEKLHRSCRKVISTVSIML